MSQKIPLVGLVENSATRRTTRSPWPAPTRAPSRSGLKLVLGSLFSSSASCPDGLGTSPRSLWSVEASPEGQLRPAVPPSLRADREHGQLHHRHPWLPGQLRGRLPALERALHGDHEQHPGQRRRRHRALPGQLKERNVQGVRANGDETLMLGISPERSANIQTSTVRTACSTGRSCRLAALSRGPDADRRKPRRSRKLDGCLKRKKN